MWGSAAQNGTQTYLPSSTRWSLLTWDTHHLRWAASAEAREEPPHLPSRSSHRVPNLALLEVDLPLCFPSDRSIVTGPSKGTTLSAVPPSTSELPYESLYSDSTPSTSYVQRDGELLAWQNQSTQTEWIYESKSGKGDCILRAITQRAGGGNAFHAWEILWFQHYLSC